MPSVRLDDGSRRLVVAGFCLGMGLGPFVLTVLTVPVDFLLGEPFVSLFWPAVQFLAVVFAVVVLSMVERASVDDEATTPDGPNDPPASRR